MSTKVENLIAYLKIVDLGTNPLDLRKKDPVFFDSITPSDYAKALELMFLSQMPIENIRAAAKKYEPLVNDQLHKIWSSLDYSHPLRKIFAEHEIYYCMLADLENLDKKIQFMENFHPQSSEIRQLAHIIQHLAATEEHDEYEQDIIYPELVKKGLLKLVRFMNTEHMYIKVSISSAIRLLDNIGKESVPSIKSKLKTTLNYIANMIKNHLFVENYIAYPLALEYITNPDVWEHIKNMCEEIGYCGIHSTNAW